MKRILTIAALLVAAPAGAASAEDSSCSDGYVQSGPYCVNPLYVNNPLFVDPATCEYGYFQGSCTPAPDAPVVLEDAAYVFQTPVPSTTAGTVSVSGRVAARTEALTHRVGFLTLR
jgi:hypothetical protein